MRRATGWGSSSPCLVRALQAPRLAASPLTRRFEGSAFDGPLRWLCAEGKNDGSVQGIQYFVCHENCGLFVRAAILQPEAYDHADCPPGSLAAW